MSPPAVPVSVVATSVFVTVHKGASTFVADDLASAMHASCAAETIVNVGDSLIGGSDYDSLPMPPTGVMAVRVYPQDVAKLVELPEAPDGRFSDKRLVLLMRDPRDVAISLYYSKAFSHSTRVRDPDRLLAERAELRDMGAYDGVAHRTMRPAVREFKLICAIAEMYPHAIVTTYEELLAGPVDWIERVAKHLELTEGQTRIVQERCADSFVIPEVVDPNRHKRRMTPGNWHEVFDSELRERFETLAGLEMAAQGYTW